MVAVDKGSYCFVEQSRLFFSIGVSMARTSSIVKFVVVDLGGLKAGGHNLAEVVLWWIL